ncbi:MAG TPA: S-adenosylmethionine:tRNA ribosyltransferase-isomerase [Urbifossiella sp.]|jgi:S-adenosylmethionine:tRNA ribosyltransferase-isomerase|nr:S-adenosylmethionine:tRNA ribosyltransferase-isomerase [Urbifossiella sp.]
MESARFDFDLPPALIPAAPPDNVPRDHARLVVLDRRDGRVEHRRFDDLGDYLRVGDALVVNNALVSQGELKGVSRGGPVRVTLCGPCEDGWCVLARPATRVRRGVAVRAADGAVRVTFRRPLRDAGMWLARVEHDGDLMALLDRHGDRHSPTLRALGDRRHVYQNVYATRPGALEVPSAGLHFTPELLDRLRTAGGVSVAPVTLNVGLTEVETYSHIAADRVEDHRVAAEWYEVPAATARAVAAARRRGGRVVAVGTTVVRTLETAGASGRVKPGAGWSDLYLRPGYDFRAVDVMLTNLHRPRSSHLVLVASFAGVDFVMRAYQEIVREGYRFDMFGDSMLII